MFGESEPKLCFVDNEYAPPDLEKKARQAGACSFVFLMRGEDGIWRRHCRCADVEPPLYRGCHFNN